jgi:hypothetical protein
VLQKGTASVPWGQIEATSAKIISHGAPSHISLKEPSYMTRSNVAAIYDYWYEKQADDQVPLSFIDPVARLTSKRNHSWKLARNVRFSKVEEVSVDESGGEQEQGQAEIQKKGKSKEVEPCPRSPAAAENRLRYLESLSKYEGYRNALRLLDYSVCNLFALTQCGQVIFKQGPPTTPLRIVPASWCTWTYSETLLPESFYVPGNDDQDHWSSFTKWLKDSSWAGNRPNSIASHQFIELILLGLGLALREIDFALFTEEEDFPDDAPSFVQSLKLSAWDEMTGAADTLEAALKRWVVS